MNRKKKALRRKMMAYASGDRNALAKTKARAARIRAQLDLCKCSDNERFYSSEEEAQNDQAPPITCACGKQKLIVRLINLSPTVGRAEAEVISGFLK